MKNENARVYPASREREKERERERKRERERREREREREIFYLFQRKNWKKEREREREIFCLFRRKNWKKEREGERREREREGERERERERERNFLSVSRKKLGDVAKLIKGDGKLKGIDKLKILVNFLESNRCFSIFSNDNNNLFFFICNHLFNLSSSKRETFLYKYKVFEAPFFEDYSLKE